MAPIRTLLIALLASTIIAAPHRVRQLAGEGNAADSILTSTDNGVGYGVENAEDNTASLITTVKSGGSPVRKRQADKIANGAANVLNAAGAPAAANEVQTSGDSLDGDLTDGATNLGADAGTTEEDTLEDAGSAVPKH